MGEGLHSHLSGGEPWFLSCRSIKKVFILLETISITTLTLGTGTTGRQNKLEQVLDKTYKSLKLRIIKWLHTLSIREPRDLIVINLSITCFAISYSPIQTASIEAQYIQTGGNPLLSRSEHHSSSLSHRYRDIELACPCWYASGEEGGKTEAQVTELEPPTYAWHGWTIFPMASLLLSPSD